MQDLLIRWHRMQGDNTLWMAGTDHAGIATQAVVEKRLRSWRARPATTSAARSWCAASGSGRTSTRSASSKQQQAMGCSCDWDRQRFTMDDGVRAGRAALRRSSGMFRDGLIYRGDRLVNWDCQLQTAVADDEVVTRP